MTKEQIKNKILEKIKQLENPLLLEEIYNLLELESSDLDVYKLSLQQQKAIEEGLTEYNKRKGPSEKDQNKLNDKNDLYFPVPKSKIINAINNSPDEISLEDLIDKLILIQKIEEAQQQSKQGLRFSEKEAKAKIKKWSK